MEAKPVTSPRAKFSVASVRGDVVAGLVSSTVAIPLAMAFGMFAFVTLGDEYFAYGAMAGLMSAFIAGVVCVVLGDRSTRLYAPGRLAGLAQSSCQRSRPARCSANW